MFVLLYSRYPAQQVTCMVLYPLVLSNKEDRHRIFFNTEGINTECPELRFHFDCVQPALVEVEVLFCRVCTFHCDCAGIARQAFQYSGSVAYLVPLTGDRARRRRGLHF